MIEVYYSDFLLEEKGFLKPIPMSLHRAKMIALLLLADRVHIPFTHILNLSNQRFDQLFVGDLRRSKAANFLEFVHADMIGTKLSVETQSLSEHIGSFAQRYQVEANSLRRKEHVLANEVGLPITGRFYDGRIQVGIFRDVMKRKMIHEPELFDDQNLLRILLESDDWNKEIFDSLVKGGRASSRREANAELLRTANLAYFSAGAVQNVCPVSGSSYFTNENVAELNQMIGDRAPAMSPFYDPWSFLRFLVSEGVVSRMADLNCLTLEDVMVIKGASCYASFLEAYEAIYGCAGDLTRMINARCAFRSGRSAFLVILLTLVGMASFDGGYFGDVNEFVSSVVGMPAGELRQLLSSYMTFFGGASLLGSLAASLSDRPLDAETFLAPVRTRIDPLGSFCYELKRSVSKYGISGRGTMRL